jgi:F-type H+-transporting ATPase subunit gamma
MPSTHDIRRRIKSIGNTSQITKAMQMVAASKMRRAQEAARITRPFAQLLYRIQRHATTHARDFTHPLLEVRQVRKRAVILVGTDKGLCGALNSNLFRLVAQFDPATTLFIAAGKRAAQFIARTGRQLVAEFTFSDTPRFDEARPIASFARDIFLKGEVDQVQVVAPLRCASSSLNSAQRRCSNIFSATTSTFTFTGSCSRPRPANRAPVWWP